METRKQLLAKSRYVLHKSPKKRTIKQSIKVQVLFKEYPDIEKDYRLLKNFYTSLIPKQVKE